MKHRFTLPYLEDDAPDVAGWARSHGWYVTDYVWANDRLPLRRDTRTVLTVTLVPVPGAFPDHRVQVTASSGATLIYDDAERSMAVTLQSEPEDAVPSEPQDAIPARQRRRRSGRPPKGGYMAANVSVPEMGPLPDALTRPGAGVPDALKYGQQCPRGVVRPPLVTVRQETPPPATYIPEDR